MFAGQGNAAGRARRASTYFLLAVLMVCVGGGWFLWHHDRVTREVYVATMDLPAYHQITPTDVRRTHVRSAEVPRHATADPNTLVGHYTLAAARRDRPLSLDRLGPRLPVDALSKHLVVGLPASTAEIGGRALGRGDRIRILLSSTSAEEPRNGSVRAIVLDVTPDGKEPGRFVVVCAFPETDEAILLTTGGTARTFLVRVPPTSPP